MTAESGAVVAVRMPQVNVNDDEVTLVSWRVADEGRVAEGEPLCEIETSKAVGDLPSPADGVLRHAARVGDSVHVDQVVAFIGPSAEVIDSYVSMLHRHDANRMSAVSGSVQASAGAVELARKAGIDVSSVPASDGRIRRSDVERYLAEHPAAGQGPPTDAHAPAMADDVLPPPLQNIVEEVDALSAHQWGVAQHLKQSQNRLVVAHALMDVDVSKATQWIDHCKQSGRLVSLLPVLIKAAAAGVATCQNLQAFRIHRRVFRYRRLDIAFTARSHQGRLYTPVVREVGQTALDDLAVRCGEMAMACFRGEMAELDLVGGCLTVSLLNEQPVRFHVGLQNNHQSALLTSGAVREELRLIDGRPVAVPTVTLALSYDHGLLDGWDAAAALDAARRAIENWEL